MITDDGNILKRPQIEHADFVKIRGHTVNVIYNVVSKIPLRIKNIGNDNNLQGIRKLAIPRHVYTEVKLRDISKVYIEALNVYYDFKDNLDKFKVRIDKLVVPPCTFTPKHMEVPIDLTYLLGLHHRLTSLVTLLQRSKDNEQVYQANLKTIQRLFDSIDDLLKAIERLKEDWTLLGNHKIDLQVAHIPKADYNFEPPDDLPNVYSYYSVDHWIPKDTVGFEIHYNDNKVETIRL